LNLEADKPAVFRVSFTGTELNEVAMAGLDGAGVAWEGSEAVSEGAWCHRVRVAAIDEQGAIAAVRTALNGRAALGAYTALAASVVRNSRGEVRRGPVAPSWADIDWQADPRRARLTGEQRALIGCLLDDAEPTWVIASDPDVSSDRRQVESALTELQAEGLVFSVLSQAVEPGTEPRLERWWGATDECWDLLGLIKSPRYASWTRGASES
jgi:hypothetical protein